VNGGTEIQRQIRENADLGGIYKWGNRRKAWTLSGSGPFIKRGLITFTNKNGQEIKKGSSKNSKESKDGAQKGGRGKPPGQQTGEKAAPRHPSLGKTEKKEFAYHEWRNKKGDSGRARGATYNHRGVNGKEGTETAINPKKRNLPKLTRLDQAASEKNIGTVTSRTPKKKKAPVGKGGLKTKKEV